MEEETNIEQQKTYVEMIERLSHSYAELQKSNPRISDYEFSALKDAINRTSALISPKE